MRMPRPRGGSRRLGRPFGNGAQRAGNRASTRSTTSSIGRPVVSMGWRHRPAARAPLPVGIAGVAGEDLLQQTVECNGNPLFFQLLMTPFGPFFGAGGQEDLAGGVREDHRPHVAPSATRPGRPAEARWRSFRAARTSGMAAMAEAAAPAVSVRKSSVASLPLTMTAGSPPPFSMNWISVSKVQRTSAEASERSMSSQPAAMPTARYSAPESEVVPAQALGDQAADGALAGPGRAVDGEDGTWGTVQGLGSVMVSGKMLLRNHLSRRGKPVRMRGFVCVPPFHFCRGSS